MADPSGETARRVATAMAADLGWDEAAANDAAEAFLEEARLEGIVVS